METPISEETAGSMLVSDYVFAIAYAYKKETEKRDFYRLEMTYDIDKLKKINKKYKANIDMLELDMLYDKKEYDIVYNLDNDMAELLILVGDKFMNSTGSVPRNLKIMKGQNENKSLFFYSFLLENKKTKK